MPCPERIKSGSMQRRCFSLEWSNHKEHKEHNVGEGIGAKFTTFFRYVFFVHYVVTQDPHSSSPLNGQRLPQEPIRYRSFR
jgi:hypothetical protein